MAGLLDFYGDSRANMALAAGLLGGGNFGQALGRGMAGAEVAMTAAEERKLRASQAAENEARAKHYQDQQAQQVRAAMRESLFQQALQQGLQPQELATFFPEKVDLIQKLAGAKNFGRDEVARTAEIEGPNGGKTIQGYSKYGDAIGAGVNGYVPPQGVNLGNKYVFTKPQAGVSLDMGQSPDSLASQAVQMRGQNMTDARARERLAFDKQGGAEAGKPQWNSELGGFVDPKTRVVMPALDQQGNPVPTNKGKLTESEGKSTLYLSQMREATKALEDIGGNTSPLMVAATGSPYTNWMAGDNSQKAGQAQRQWAEAYLREKTGAAATAGEVENNIRTFFPVVGDSPAVIAQKKAARADAEKAMEIPAGRGATRIAPAMTPKQNGWSIQRVE